MFNEELLENNSKSTHRYPKWPYDEQLSSRMSVLNFIVGGLYIHHMESLWNARYLKILSLSLSIYIYIYIVKQKDLPRNLLRPVKHKSFLGVHSHGKTKLKKTVRPKHLIFQPKLPWRMACKLLLGHKMIFIILPAAPCVASAEAVRHISN